MEGLPGAPPAGTGILTGAEGIESFDAMVGLYAA
jgi:hypothetical protein